MPDFATRLAEFIAAQRQPPVQSREPIVTTAPRPTQPIPESREERQRRLSENQIRSTLGDSLNALSGGGRPNASPIAMPQSLITRLLGTAPAAGTYMPIGDRLSAPTEDGRRLTIHEYGHRRQLRTPQGRSALIDPVFVIPNSNTEAASYNKTNRKEAYAEAFKSAFEFLDLTRKVPNMSPAQRERYLARRESAHPGTTRLFNEMLNEPLYANHPLRKPQGGR
jgi:hypothetical protein